MIIAIEGPELTDVNLMKFQTAGHANSIVSVFMTVHISVFASLVSCIMFSVREGFGGWKSQGSPFVSNAASVSFRPKYGCYIKDIVNLDGV